MVVRHRSARGSSAVAAPTAGDSAGSPASRAEITRQRDATDQTAKTKAKTKRRERCGWRVGQEGRGTGRTATHSPSNDFDWLFVRSLVVSAAPLRHCPLSLSPALPCCGFRSCPVPAGDLHLLLLAAGIADVRGSGLWEDDADAVRSAGPASESAGDPSPSGSHRPSAGRDSSSLRSDRLGEAELYPRPSRSWPSWTRRCATRISSTSC